jgi:hypothetical protein
MAVRQPHHTKEEAYHRGEEIYNRDIRPNLQAEDQGKYVAIDIDTGGWEMDIEEVVAGNRLLARFPNAQIWMTRAGYGYIRRFGAGRRRRGT